MDELTGRWVGMEKQQSFPQGISLVLYDLTSVYFEGDGPEGTSQYGHSRDHRPDRPQVLLAVATDVRGVPLHLEVLRGNRGDTTTLQGIAPPRFHLGVQPAIRRRRDPLPVQPGNSYGISTRKRTGGLRPRLSAWR